MILESDGWSETTAFHPRVTVVRGTAVAGREFAGHLAQALCGDVDGVHVEVNLDGRDMAVFRPDDDGHRVIDVERARDVTADFRDVEGRVDLLRGSGLDATAALAAMHVAGDPVPPTDDPTAAHTRPLALALALVAAGGAAYVAGTAVEIGVCLVVAVIALVAAAVTGRGPRDLDDVDADALVRSIRLAQDSTWLADPLPVVVTDLFESLPPGRKGAALDAAIAASEGGQVVIVTDDPDVLDLAGFREMAGQVGVVNSEHDASIA